MGVDPGTQSAPEDPGSALAGLRVIVAEDDVLLREGLASLLTRSGFDVVGQAGDATELLALARENRPDVVIVDIRMPPSFSTEGLDAARQIRADLPDTGIMVLSAHVDVEHAMELLAGGHGIGYLLKTRVTDVADFIDSLERVAKGASVVDPALVQELVSGRRRDDPLAVLSTREHEVLELMAEGRSNAGIARRLWVTEGTVEKHVRSILTKLDLGETDDDHRRVRAVITFLESR
ncbi:response regulator transcription factor [Mycobacterium sp.]|jgi:DNA-binding NarL/FixJ family response regulator|uniref:response regulator transcription factor n=1 Tax=Mycobacterium sp. TaxID=1785 RepID=UPI0039C9BB03